MQRKCWPLVTVLVLILVLGIVTPPSAFAQPTDKIGVLTLKPGDPIHIAYMLVVAGSEASIGEDSKRGIELAIDDMGGKLLGRPIKLSGTDSGCNAEGGTAAATKLASDPTIVAVIGSSCSSEARPGAPIITKAGMVMVSPSNTAPFLTDANRGPDYAGYLRTAHNDLVQGAVAAQFAWEHLQVKTAATIHDGSPYAEQLQSVFAETFRKFGGTITSQEAVAPTDTDMRPVLTKISKATPALIYYPIFVAAGGQVTSQAKKIAGLEKTILMGADGLFSPDFLKAAGKAAEGMYLSSPDFSAFGDKYTNDFLPKHEKKYASKPLSAFHAHAYDATMLIFAAIQKVAQAGPDGTLYIGRQALREALFATKDLKGLTGNLACTPYGDCADPKIAVYQLTAENLAKNAMPEKPVWKPF
jgi:branched-chain amino acid transport system substrate-binding protein